MLDLDFSPWAAEEVRELRGQCTQIAISEMLGVRARLFRRWEREGITSSGWTALLRIYLEEDRDVRPLNCSIAALEELSEILGSYSELARELEVDRSTITRWRYRVGFVPGAHGYGRIVRICFEDVVL